MSVSPVVIRNVEGWQITTLSEQGVTFIQLRDKWGLVVEKSLFLCCPSLSEKDNAEVFFSKEIQRLTTEPDAHAFFVQQHAGKTYLVFSKFGLLGGGQEEAKVAGTVMIIGGLTTIFATLPDMTALTMVGCVALGMGISSLVYSVGVDERDYRLKDQILAGVSGSAAGLLAWTRLLNV